MNSIKSMLIAAFMAVLAAILGTGMSYAWYVSHPLEVAAESKMGSIDISIVKNFESSTKGDEKTFSYTLTNKSSIDIYLRFGATPLFKTSSGEDLPLPVEQVYITLTSADISNYDMMPY